MRVDAFNYSTNKIYSSKYATAFAAAHQAFQKEATTTEFSGLKR
jgi:hypothetical protein